jgi:hypothetical protein
VREGEDKEESWNLGVGEGWEVEVKTNFLEMVPTE